MDIAIIFDIKLTKALLAGLEQVPASVLLKQQSGGENIIGLL